MGSTSLRSRDYGTNDAFTPDELYTHIRCFKEKLKQAGDYHVEPKQIAFPARSNVKHEVSKDTMLLLKMF
jgi:hypothetical protein